MPGVVAVLTGADAAADKIGAHIPGVTLYSKDGSPMKVGGFSALAHAKALYVGDPVVVVIADTYAEAGIIRAHLDVSPTFDRSFTPPVIQTASP